VEEDADAGRRQLVRILLLFGIEENALVGYQLRCFLLAVVQTTEHVGAAVPFEPRLAIGDVLPDALNVDRFWRANGRVPVAFGWDISNRGH